MKKIKIITAYESYKQEIKSLRSRLEKAEKVIEAARPTLVFHYDSTVQIDYQRALEKAMNTYDQPAPIRKEGEGKEV